MFTITKLAVTAILVVLISEVGKFNDKLSGLIAALPVVTILVVCWMYFEGGYLQQIHRGIDPDEG